MAILFYSTFSDFCIKIYHLIYLKGITTIALVVLVELYHNHHSPEVRFITL